MSNGDIKAEVKRIAGELGFSECRIAAARPATHAREFEQWIADGCHADMAWMARQPDRRTNPQAVLEGVKSIIVVAMNYTPKEPVRKDEEAQDSRGVIARYAWGLDYHDLMEAKLKELAAKLEAFGGTHRVYVDTGPVLERDFASDAGLGWNGKSTVQIHPKLGTWFFLGEILTSLELTPDEPMSSHCGRCVRCLNACPTGAITEPHRVDARRCVSYLTIEHKGPIPMEFRRAMGARIYGCDDCLAVCPWNKFAQSSQEAWFHAKEYVHDWKLRDFLALTDDSFRELFRGSPIKRTKRPRFLRNVCVALGNVGTEEDREALKLAALDPDPLIAEHAAWALAELEKRLFGKE